MADLPENWKKSKGTPHLHNEKDGVTIWVAHGGIVGVNEMALYTSIEKADEVYALPLSVVREACDNAKAPSFAVRWMTAGEKDEIDRNMKMVSAGTITNCILAMCSYCKASADTGMTTEHTCTAKPLWELWSKKMDEISDE